MLTFLRRIRRALIDSSSFRKYLFYAIGEILLVMIGILLALQVNTWNNNRIDRKLEIQYLHRIVQDLKADLDEVELATNTTYRRILLGADVLDTLQAESIKDWSHYQIAVEKFKNNDFEIPERFGTRLTQLRFFRGFNGTDITMQELLSNGRLDVIRDEELRIAIQDHYSKIEIKKFFIELVITARNEFVQELTSLGISVASEDNYKKIRRMIDDRSKLIAHIENILSLASGVVFDFEESEDSIKKKTERLIVEIENYLETL